MKQRFPHLITIAIMSFLCFACAPKEKVETDSGLTSLSQVNTITLAQYNLWKTSWEEKGQSYTSDTLLRYFTMPLIDLQEFATQSHAEARFYMGLDTTLVPFEAHLMLVGVDSNGQTILPSTRNPSAKIYDFTKPCPMFCPDTR